MTVVPSSILTLILVYFILQDVGVGEEDCEEPYFVGPIGNVSVALGREAILNCTVRSLGHYRVAWLKAEDYTVLTLDSKVITFNPRISVSVDKESETWKLHIRQLKHSDKGCYMCQINTGSMKQHTSCLDVLVGPKIIDTGSSSDVVVEEGNDVVLRCAAKGYPKPRIFWKREDSRAITYFSKTKGFCSDEIYNGEQLQMLRIDYTQMGAYLCIATNDIPPAVSKRIVLQVNFGPVPKMVTNQLVGVVIGGSVTLRCVFHSFPNDYTSWDRDIGSIEDYGGDFSVDVARFWYEVTMSLTIHNVRTIDLGRYFCSVSNDKGIARTTVQVYEIPSETASTTRPSVEDVMRSQDTEEEVGIDKAEEVSSPGQSHFSSSVSPKIVDTRTTSDITVDEGSNVTLSCKAKGYPKPRIFWKREDGQTITFSAENRLSTAETLNGEELQMLRIHYTQMGAYLCIATNDVPPPASKRVILNINFAPVPKMVTSQLVEAAIGGTVTLQCVFHSFPNDYTSWHRDIASIEDYGGDYSIEVTRLWYEVTMSLTIRKIRTMDLGRYFCSVRNKKGIARTTVQVYDVNRFKGIEQMDGIEKVQNSSPKQFHYISSDSGKESCQECWLLLGSIFLTHLIR